MRTAKTNPACAGYAEVTRFARWRAASGLEREVEWMEDAYDVTLTEEQKMVTVRTFTAANTKEPNDGT